MPPVLQKTIREIHQRLRALETREYAEVVGPGSVINAQYLTLALHAVLTAERRFVDGDGLVGTDAGANADYTLDIDLVAAWSGLEFVAGELRIDEDAAFTWAGAHTFNANILLAGGVTIDGMDPSAFMVIYAAHDHSAGDPTQVDHADLINVLANQHHAENHVLLSAPHTDTLAAAVIDGDVIIGNTTPRWSRLAIAIPAANVRNVLGIDNAELRPSWKTALDNVNPADIAGAAAPGTSLIFSHRDHVHAHPGGLGVDLHHTQIHDVVGGDHTLTGAQWNLVGATALNTIGLLLASSNPGAAAAILMSTAAGGLTLVDLTLTDDLLLAAGSVVGITPGNIERIVFNADSILVYVPAAANDPAVIQLEAWSGATAGAVTLTVDSDAAITRYLSLAVGRVYAAGDIYLDGDLVALGQLSAGAGAAEGLILGADAQWYRSAANILRTPDSVTIDVGLNVGTTGAVAGQVKIKSSAAPLDVLIIDASAGNSQWIIRESAGNNLHLKGHQTDGTQTILLQTLGDSYLNMGNLTIGDTAASSKMSLGLTINQGAYDNEIMAFQSDDVATGATDIADTNTFGLIMKGQAAAGGVKIIGLKDADGVRGLAAILQAGLAENVDTTKDGTAHGLVHLEGGQLSGTTWANIVANGNVVVMKGYVGGAFATLWILDEDGDVYIDGTQNVFDEYDDAVMAWDATRVLADRGGDILRYNKDALVAAGIMSPAGWISQRGTTKLLMGAVGQLWQQDREADAQREAIIERIGILENQLALLDRVV